jgi:hypothetical protein
LLSHRIRDKLDNKIDKKLDSSKQEVLLEVKNTVGETEQQLKRDFEESFAAQKDIWAVQFAQLEKQHREEVEELREHYKVSMLELKGLFIFSNSLLSLCLYMDKELNRFINRTMATRTKCS